MKIRDAEDLIKSFREFVRDNFNNEITLINSEKTDFNIEELPADDDHFCFFEQIEEIPEHDVITFNFSQEIESQTRGSDRSLDMTIEVAYWSEHQARIQQYFASLRYMRAIEQTVLKYSIPELDQINIVNNFLPEGFSLERKMLASGVRANIVIA